MKQESNRFTIYLQKLGGFIEEADREGDQAKWLLKSNARGILFMLEALARIFSVISDQNLFGKLIIKFKDFEDGLGKMDFCFSVEEQFKINKNIPKKYLHYFKEKSTRKTDELNSLLTKEEWISNNDNSISKITKKLEKLDWMDVPEETLAISGYYKSEITKINKFINKTNFQYSDIESDVHELRRKLRWLSIYPQALQGVFQFNSNITTESHLAKYLTKEIIASPFNQLPNATGNTDIILLNKNYFLALSWMIAELGRLKDEGLILTGLAEAIMETDGMNDDEAMIKAYSLLGESQSKMPEILKQAEVISKVFFSENNLEHLLA